MSFSCLLTPACSVCPQDLCCRGTAGNREAISAAVGVRLSPSQLCSCISGCVEGVSMDECMEVWEIWHWCFPLLHTHIYKSLLVFLHQLSSKLPRMMTRQVWALLDLEAEKHPRNYCGDISEISRREIKVSDYILIKVCHRRVRHSKHLSSVSRSSMQTDPARSGAVTELQAYLCIS